MKLTLVNKTNEAKDTKSFFFTTNKKITWKAGQYVVLKLKDLEKPFTIASSPTEKIIQISTRIRQDSKFKQNLDKIENGQEIEARGPFGSFVFLNLKSEILNHVFLAGGIGITPFRSFIKYNIDKKLNIPIYLVYSNSDNEFVFKKELDNWQKHNKFIKIYYHNSSISGHLDLKKISLLLKTYKLDHLITWVVGPTVFVNSMEDILENLHIKNSNIRTEKFIGY